MQFLLICILISSGICLYMVWKWEVLMKFKPASLISLERRCSWPRDRISEAWLLRIAL